MVFRFGGRRPPGTILQISDFLGCHPMAYLCSYSPVGRPAARQLRSVLPRCRGSGSLVVLALGNSCSQFAVAAKPNKNAMDLEPAVVRWLHACFEQQYVRLAYARPGPPLHGVRSTSLTSTSTFYELCLTSEAPLAVKANPNKNSPVLEPAEG